jgi:molybdate transport system substrate-binding protein
VTCVSLLVSLAAGRSQAQDAAKPAPASGKTLLVLAGAGLQKAVDELAKEFTQQTGAKIETNYGGSGQLIANLQLHPEGDVFIPGDIGYVEKAEEKGLIASKAVFSYFVPVILVKKGNPDHIRTVADFARPGLKLGLGDPDKCQVGVSSQQIFAKNKVGAEAIQKNLVFNSATVNELGLQVTVGKLDATIVWDAVAAEYAGKADVVAIPPEQNVTTRVAAAVLKGAKEPKLAETFVDFLKSPKAVEVLKANKYRTEPPEAAKQAGETPAPQAAKQAGETPAPQAAKQAGETPAPQATKPVETPKPAAGEAK